MSWRGLAALCLIACSGAAAQPAPVLPESLWATPQGVARLFQQACVLKGGEAAPAVDWALSEGFEPADALRGNVESLLSGQPGSVLAAPGTSGRVLLAVAQGRQCTVWADQMQGPALRIAMIEMLAVQASKGARVQMHADRNLERAGAWRNQTQWRYRAVGVVQEMGLGAVTTLSDAPATQALQAAPLVATPAFSPDGVPTR